MQNIILSVLVSCVTASSQGTCTYPGGDCYEISMQKCKGSDTWTMHGLWPQWTNGCSGPSFNYDSLSSLKADLDQYWPSCPEYGGDDETFWSHEWEKHGTCTGMTEVDFFSKGLQLRSQYSGNCNGDAPCSVCVSKDFSTQLDCGDSVKNSAIIV